MQKEIIAVLGTQAYAGIEYIHSISQNVFEDPELLLLIHKHLGYFGYEISNEQLFECTTNYLLETRTSVICPRIEKEGVNSYYLNSESCEFYVPCKVIQASENKTLAQLFAQGEDVSVNPLETSVCVVFGHDGSVRRPENTLVELTNDHKSVEKHLQKLAVKRKYIYAESIFYGLLVFKRYNSSRVYSPSRIPKFIQLEILNYMK